MKLPPPGSSHASDRACRSSGRRRRLLHGPARLGLASAGSLNSDAVQLCQGFVTREIINVSVCVQE